MLSHFSLWLIIPSYLLNYHSFSLQPNFHRLKRNKLLLLLLPLALQPTVGFGLSNNVLPFFPICDQLSPSSHSQHLKISFLLPLSIYSWVFPFFSSLPVLEWRSFLGILSSSILCRWPNQLILCPFIHFTVFSPLLISSSSPFVRLFHKRNKLPI